MTRLSEEDTENLIRDSLDRLAARAPDGEEIREVLQGSRQPLRRPRMALALVAAAVALIALGVPVGIQVFSGKDGTSPASQRNADWAVLPYAPGWLPDGFRELDREARPYPAPQTRTWSGGEQGQIKLSTTPLSDEWSAPWTIAPVRDQIIVHGKVGMASKAYGDLQTILTWSPDDEYLVTLSLMGVTSPLDVGQKIAESIVEDGHTRVEGELRFGSLPADLALNSVHTYAMLRGGATDIGAAHPGQPNAAPVVKATINGEPPDLLGAEPITARGTAAHYRPSRVGQDPSIVVPVAGNRWLTVSGQRERATLLEIANTVQLLPVDYGWFGSRPE